MLVNVRFWPIADIQSCLRMSAFGDKADINSMAEVLNFFKAKIHLSKKRAQWWDSARKRANLLIDRPTLFKVLFWLTPLRDKA